MLGNSTFNTFKYCGITSSNKSINKGTIYMDNDCTTCYNEGIQNNTFDFCDIFSGNSSTLNAIYSKGAQDTISNPIFSNINNRVSNCNIKDYFSTTKNSNGIFLDKGNSHWTFFRNSFYQTSLYSNTSILSNTHRDIFINHD